MFPVQLYRALYICIVHCASALCIVHLRCASASYALHLQRVLYICIVHCICTARGICTLHGNTFGFARCSGAACCICTARGISTAYRNICIRSAALSLFSDQKVALYSTEMITYRLIIPCHYDALEAKEPQNCHFYLGHFFNMAGTLFCTYLL